MEAHHYLGFRSPFGAVLRHVAKLPGREWAALPGWSSGVCKVKARERWLGWLPERQFRRLHLIADNTRFPVLPDLRVLNLTRGSWVLSARHLSSDMEALRGHSVLLAETFVDPTKFAGTCCRTAGWKEIGETRGFGQDSDGWWEHESSGALAAAGGSEGIERVGRAGGLRLRFSVSTALRTGLCAWREGISDRWPRPCCQFGLLHGSND